MDLSAAFPVRRDYAALCSRWQSHQSLAGGEFGVGGFKGDEAGAEL